MFPIKARYYRIILLNLDIQKLAQAEISLMAYRLVLADQMGFYN